MNTPAIAQSRFTAINWKNDTFAIWDNYKHTIAVGGTRLQLLVNMTQYGANRWSNIFNVVERGGCGMCSQRLAANAKVHWHPDYKWICTDCFQQ